MDWPPPAPQERLVGSPWRPQSIHDVSGPFDYAVVEEIEGDEIRTVVSGWPLLTSEGHLSFGDPEAAQEYVDVRSDLEELLGERRIVRVDDLSAPMDAMRRRPVEIGDVFAIPQPPGGGGGGDGGGGGGGGGLGPLIGGRPVYDITADARLAAQAAHSAAVAGTLEPEDVERFLDLGQAEDEPPEPHDGGAAPVGTPGAPTAPAPDAAVPEPAPSLASAVRRETTDVVKEDKPKELEAGA